MTEQSKLGDLKDRYGDRLSYGLLTERQTEFLLNPSIKDSKDGGGFHTVEFKEIIRGEKGPIVRISDSLSYLFKRNDPGVHAYARQRLPCYEQASGAKARNETDSTFVFTLDDGSEVRAEFLTIKDRI